MMYGRCRCGGVLNKFDTNVHGVTTFICNTCGKKVRIRDVNYSSGD